MKLVTEKILKFNLVDCIRASNIVYLDKSREDMDIDSVKVDVGKVAVEKTLFNF